MLRTDRDRTVTNAVTIKSHNELGRSGMLRLHCLGRLELSRDGELLPIRRRKSAMLLAYLARNPGRPHGREGLATLLWGDRDDDRARQSLRQALTDVRDWLERGIDTEQDDVNLRPGLVDVDVTEFEGAIAAGRLEAGAELWTGEFLAGIDEALPEAGREWVAGERMNLAKKMLWALERLTAAAEARGDSVSALEWVTRWSALAPYQEGVARRRIELLWQQGRLADAIAVHAEFGHRLQADLDARPTPEFQAMMAAAPAPATTEIGMRGFLTPDLVGRTEQLGALSAAWQATLGGPGLVVLVTGGEGLGKSRLLAEFARIVRARSERSLILEARGFAADRDRPFATARDLLSPLARAPGIAAAAPESLAALAAVVPEVAARFTNLPAPAPGSEPAAELSRVVGEVADEVPVLALIDDVEAADPASAALVALWIRRPPRRTLVVVTTSDGGTAGSPIAAALADAGERVTRIRLAPLTAEQLGRLAGSMVPFEPGTLTTLAPWLFAETGGTPATARRLLDDLADRSVLVAGADGRWRIAGELAPGEAAGREAAERLERLTAEGRAVMEAAAVLGDGASPLVLEQLSELPVAGFQGAVGEVLSRRLLREGSRGYEFPGESGRRAVLAGLAPSRRLALHRRAAVLVERAGGNAGEIERHWREAGGRPPRARRWGWAAALLLAAGAVAGGAVWRSRAARVEPGSQILLADLRNGTGDPAFDQALVTAATVGLQQSRQVVIFPRNRMVETLRRMGRPSTDSVMSEATALEIAQRNNVRMVLALGVDRIEDTYLLTARLVDPPTGTDLRTARVEARGKGEVVGALDRLMDEVRRALGESRAAVAGGVGLMQATTPSLDALKAYSIGERAWSQGRYIEAADGYRRALALDSTFARANLALARFHYVQKGDREAGDRYLARAVAQLPRLTEREQLEIRIEDAAQHGSWDRALELSRALAERFPARESWHSYGTRLMNARRCPEAIPVFRRALGFDSLYANTLINVATCFQFLGRIDSALTAYAAAAQADSTILYRQNLNHEWGIALVRSGRLAAAESAYRRMAARGSDQDRARGYRSLGYLAHFRGHLAEAAAFLDTAIAIQPDVPLTTFRNLELLASVKLDAGDRAGAQAAARRALAELGKQSSDPLYAVYMGRVLLAAGMFDQASGVARSLAATVDSSRPHDLMALQILEALVRNAGRDPAPVPRIAVDPTDPLVSYYDAARAQAFARSGRFDSAVVAATKVSNEWTYGTEPQFLAVAALTEVARYAEAGGDPETARAALSRLLDQWREADPATPAVAQARRALSRLQEKVAR